MEYLDRNSESETKTSSRVTLDEFSRVVNIIIIACLVGTVCHVYNYVSILLIKVSMALILLSIMEATMALPISTLASPQNMSLYRFISLFDTVVGIFLLVVAVMFSLCVSAVHSLWLAGAVSSNIYHSTLVTVILAWVGFFFHVLVLLKWLHEYGKVLNTESNVKHVPEYSI